MAYFCRPTHKLAPLDKNTMDFFSMAKKIPQYITIQKCNNMYHGKSPQNKNYCERKKISEF